MRRTLPVVFNVLFLLIFNIMMFALLLFALFRNKYGP